MSFHTKSAPTAVPDKTFCKWKHQNDRQKLNKNTKRKKQIHITVMSPPTTRTKFSSRCQKKYIYFNTFTRHNGSEVVLSVCFFLTFSVLNMSFLVSLPNKVARRWFCLFRLSFSVPNTSILVRLSDIMAKR